MVLVMPKGRWITINHWIIVQLPKMERKTDLNQISACKLWKRLFWYLMSSPSHLFCEGDLSSIWSADPLLPQKKITRWSRWVAISPIDTCAILVGWTPFWFPSLFPMLLGSILIGNQDDPGWENQKKKTCAELTFFSFISNYIPWHPCYICIYIYIPLYPHSIPIISPWYLHGIPILSPMKYPNEWLLLHVARHGFGWGFAGHEPGRHRNPWWFRGNIYRNCVIDGYDLGISHNLWYHIFLGYSSLYSGKLMSITEDHGDLEVHL